MKLTNKEIKEMQQLEAEFLSALHLNTIAYSRLVDIHKRKYDFWTKLAEKYEIWDIAQTNYVIDIRTKHLVKKKL